MEGRKSLQGQVTRPLQASPLKSPSPESCHTPYPLLSTKNPRCPEIPRLPQKKKNEAVHDLSREQACLPQMERPHAKANTSVIAFSFDMTHRNALGTKLLCYAQALFLPVQDFGETDLG